MKMKKTKKEIKKALKAEILRERKMLDKAKKNLESRQNQLKKHLKEYEKLKARKWIAEVRGVKKGCWATLNN